MDKGGESPRAGEVTQGHPVKAAVQAAVVCVGGLGHTTGARSGATTVRGARVSRRTIWMATIWAQRLERSMRAVAGVTGGGEFAGVGFEVLEADPGPAPDQRTFPDLGGV